MILSLLKLDGFDPGIILLLILFCHFTTYSPSHYK